jgi:hypothetical protein
MRPSFNFPLKVHCPFSGLVVPVYKVQGPFSGLVVPVYKVQGPFSGLVVPVYKVQGPFSGLVAYVFPYAPPLFSKHSFWGDARFILSSYFFSLKHIPEKVGESSCIQLVRCATSYRP